MKTTLITTSISRTYPLGDDGYLKISHSAEVSLDEGDDPAACRLVLHQEVAEELNRLYLIEHPTARFKKNFY